MCWPVLSKARLGEARRCEGFGPRFSWSAVCCMRRVPQSLRRPRREPLQSKARKSQPFNIKLRLNLSHRLHLKENKISVATEQKREKKTPHLSNRPMTPTMVTPPSTVSLSSLQSSLFSLISHLSSSHLSSLQSVSRDFISPIGKSRLPFFFFFSFFPFILWSG